MRPRALVFSLLLTLALLLMGACSGGGDGGDGFGDGDGDRPVTAGGPREPGRDDVPADGGRAPADSDAPPPGSRPEPVPPDVTQIFADALGLSGTWSERPLPFIYPPALEPGDFPVQRTELYFEEQICVSSSGTAGKCPSLGTLYGRSWLTLTRVGDVRAITEDRSTYYEADYTGVLHHFHPDARRIEDPLSLRGTPSKRYAFAYDVSGGTDLVYTLTGTMAYFPDPRADFPLSLTLTGGLDGRPSIRHGLAVSMSVRTQLGLGKLNFGGSFREEVLPDGTEVESRVSDAEGIGSFFKAIPDANGALTGQVVARLSGLQITSGTVFAYVEGEETPVGSDEVDEHGFFLIEGLPVLLTEAEEGAPPGVGGRRFTVRIENGEAAIPPENRRTFGGVPTVFFSPGAAEAFPFLPMTLSLDPAVEVGIKLRLAQQLGELSERDYLKAEAPVFSYIEQVVRDSITAGELEALRRGAWAERILLEAARDADVMITDMMQALASMLGNLWDDFYNRKSENLKKLGEAQQKAEKLQAAGNQELVTFLRFGLQQGDEHYGAALSGVQTAIGDASVSKLAEAVKAGFKSLKLNLSFSFEEAGIGSETAQKLGDGILWILEMVFKTMLAGLKSQTASGTLKPLGGAAIQGVVKATAPMLFNNEPGEIFALFPGSQAIAGIFPSYTANTTPALKDSVRRMTRWNSSNPQGYQDDALVAARALVSISDEFTVVKQRVDAAAAFTDIGDTSADIASLADKLPPLKVVFVLAKIIQYTSNTCGIVEPMRFTFGYLPDWVEFGVATAYGDDPPSPQAGTVSEGVGSFCSFAVDGLMDVVGWFDDKYTNARYGISRQLRQAGPSTIVPGSPFAVSVQDVGDQYVRALRSVAAELSADRLFQASEATAAIDGDIALTERAWAELKTELTMRTSAAPSSAWGSVGEQVQQQLVSDLGELLLQSGFRQEIADLVLDVLLGAFTEPSEPEFIERRDFAVATIERLIEEVTSQQARLTLIDAALPEIEAALLIASVPPPISTSTGAGFVSERGEVFTISARIRNIGSLPAEGVSVALTLLSDESEVSLLSPSEVSISGGVLAASDGVTGSGPDEVTVEWTVRYDVEPGAFPALFDLVVLENDGPPVTFQVFDRTVELPIDFRATDTDSDGMADQFERTYDLDIGRDDSGDDDDGDGVTNIDEFRAGTDPTNPDSDGDGLTDGEELTEGDDGLVTDPLEPSEQASPAP